MVVKDYRDLLAAVDDFGLPLILKPVNSCGSQGVRSVWDPKDLQQAYRAAQQFSESILVEQIVMGHHVDVNALFVEGRFLKGGIMDRFFSELPYHYPIWGCQPSSLSAAQEDAVYSTVEKAARALGIEDGPLKADLIWTNEKPVILDLAPRFHGDVSTAHVSPLATGNSPIREWMAHLAGIRRTSEYTCRKMDRFAGWIALFPATPGRLLTVNGIEETCAMNGVHDVFIDVKPGAVIKRHIDNSTVCGFIWATGKNRDELFDLLMRARSGIRFITLKTYPE